MSYYTITIMLQSAYLPGPDRKAPSAQSEAPVLSTLSSSLDRSRAAQKGSAEDNGKDASATTSQKNDCRDSRSPTPSPALSSGQCAPAVLGDGQAQGTQRRFANPAHKICTELSNTLLHHVEVVLDSYPNWCSIQAKVNHALKVCLRVACENSKPSMTCPADREEAQAQFRMGSDLYRRLSVLPEPLTIRDHPGEKDVQYMDSVEESFREMLVTTMYDNDSDEGGEVLEREGLGQSDLDHKDRVVSELEIALNKIAPPEHIFGNGLDESFDFEFPFPTSYYNKQ